MRWGEVLVVQVSAWKMPSKGTDPVADPKETLKKLKGLMSRRYKVYTTAGDDIVGRVETKFV